MALRDIGQILSRPALARLAKIQQIAEEVADGVVTVTVGGASFG